MTAAPSPWDPYDWIERQAALRPAAPFLSAAPAEALNYGQLHAEAARFAAVLSGLGVAVGDRVVMQIDKSADAVLLYCACLYCGAVAVPLNTAYTAAELEHFFGDADPRVAIVRPRDRASLAPLARAAGCPRLETLGVDGSGSFRELLTSVVPQPPTRPALDKDALAALIYTSGTTGRSKGAMLTRGNLAANAVALVESWRFTAADVLLHTLPLFHVHGLFAALNTALAAGASLVLLPRFDAGEVLRRLAGISVYMGVPTHYTRLLHDPGLSRTSTAGVRLFVSGSAPLLAETHREFAARTGQVILERYGMTETLMNTSNPYDGTRVPGSVGPPLPGVEVRVTGAADGVGMVEIRGPNVCAGYWRDAAKSSAAFTPDGFFISGDLGALDAAGYLHIVGRAKDLVISGGYNVYPKEIESELDAVDGVVESAVIGLPHPDLGEGVTGVVVLAPGVSIIEAEVLRTLRGRLANYKIPKRLVVATELPRNAMGKVQKDLLRRTYAALYSSG